MKAYSNDELKLILTKHQMWMNGEKGGVRANLRDADLRDASLVRANLEGANLRGSHLRGVSLMGSNLRGSNLEGANLLGVNLMGSNLLGVNLMGSNLLGANLMGASLRGSHLIDANLRSVNLWDTIGNKYEIKSLQLETYSITYTSEVLQIGCQQHPIESWWGFDDETINDMDAQALYWWGKWKDVVKSLIEKSPATPTKR